MAHCQFQLKSRQIHVVGSFGSTLDLESAGDCAVRESCDLAEIRLDLLLADGSNLDSKPWKHLESVPLLFTARRIEEGGGLAMNAETRSACLFEALADCSLIDIEVASISEMKPLLEELKHRQIPWIASYHDFKQLPPPAALLNALKQARNAGASAFKVAARLNSPADLARLAEFQLADHGIPVATMGMGALGTASRLLCAQCGSVLNYGYLGKSSTAPGQWDSALLKLAISRLDRFEPAEI